MSSSATASSPGSAPGWTPTAACARTRWSGSTLTLAGYRELIDRHGADMALAVLTSAVRDAANGEEFAEAVEQRYGLTPHILTGDQEAQLTFLGATSDRDPEDKTPTLVADIGGGSTET